MLTFPIPNEPRAVIAFDPTIFELSKYMLRAFAPGSGRYTPKINGVLVATLNFENLAAGLNLTNSVKVKRKPIPRYRRQPEPILAAVAA